MSHETKTLLAWREELRSRERSLRFRTSTYDRRQHQRIVEASKITEHLLEVSRFLDQSKTDVFPEERRQTLILAETILHAYGFRLSVPQRGPRFFFALPRFTGALEVPSLSELRKWVKRFPVHWVNL